MGQSAPPLSGVCPPSRRALTRAVRLAASTLLKSGEIKSLPGPTQAADKSYIETAQKLCAGLDAWLKSREAATDSTSRKIIRLWREVSP